MGNLQYPIEVYQKAKTAYMTGTPLKKISVEMSIPFATLQTWQSNRGWAKEKKAMLAKADQSANMSIQKHIESQRDRFLKKHLDISDQFANQVEEFLANGAKTPVVVGKGHDATLEMVVDPDGIQKMAGVAKIAHEIGSKVLGLHGEQNPGKTTVVNVQIVASAVENLKQAIEAEYTIKETDDAGSSREEEADTDGQPVHSPEVVSGDGKDEAIRVGGDIQDAEVAEKKSAG